MDLIKYLNLETLSKFFLLKIQYVLLLVLSHKILFILTLTNLAKLIFLF